MGYSFLIRSRCMIGSRFMFFKKPVNQFTCFFFYFLRIFLNETRHSPLYGLAYSLTDESIGSAEYEFTAQKTRTQSDKSIYQVLSMFSGKYRTESTFN